MLLFDAHLDLAMNAIDWNRDLTQPLLAIRAKEAHLRDKPDRGRGTVSFPEMRRAQIGLCVATQIARVEHDQFSPVTGWRSSAQAWAMTRAQLAYYRAMEEAGELVQVHDRTTLERIVDLWQPPADAEAEEAPPATPPRAALSPAPTDSAPRPRPIGYVLSLEGADSLITLAHLERAWADGLRAIGPAHYGVGVYANGTDASGGFSRRGKELLREIARLGLILDATHLCDESFWEALDLFEGPVWASHQLCRSLTPHARQWNDAQILALIRRGGVLGMAFDAWMMVPGWVRGQTTPIAAGLTLARIVDHIDHICQLAGNARHVGIGSDLDGAFGTEQTPTDLDSIADLQRVPDLLRARGYAESDVQGIARENFLRFLRRAWTRGAGA